MTMGLDFFLGPIGLMALLFDVWALLSIGESRAPRGLKALWIIIILIFPIIGFLAWLILGPRATDRPIF